MNKWNVIESIFPTDEMRHSTEEENKLYSDMLERKSKTMEEYNKDNRIMNRIQEHLNDALNSKPTDWFVICGQGSINYPGLSDDQSDVDSKMLTVPSFKEIVQNLKPLNLVHVMDNDEHVDMKDLRDYFKIFRKQNINFVEILFTDYWVVNEYYEEYWLELMRYAEDFAHMNPYRTLKCCKGMVHQKAHALEHRYPSRLCYLDTFGYDGKQLQHALRILEFAKKFVKNYPYKDCLTVDDPETLLGIKRHTVGLSLEDARKMMDKAVRNMDNLEANYNSIWTDKEDQVTKEKLDNILYELIKKAVWTELSH